MGRVCDAFADSVGVRKDGGRHSTVKDVKDFDLTTSVLLTNNVFSHVPGRKHSKIPKRHHLLNKKHEPAFQTWLGKALSQKCFHDYEDEMYSSEDDSETDDTDEWETDDNELLTDNF